MVCVTRITYLSIRPTGLSSPVERERVQVFGGLVGCFCVLCLVSPPPFFFRSVFDNIPPCVTALCFPYREGLEGAFFFSVTYFSYLV